MYVFVKIMVPVCVPTTVLHLIFRLPPKGTMILTTAHIYIYIYRVSSRFRECNTIAMIRLHQEEHLISAEPIPPKCSKQSA